MKLKNAARLLRYIILPLIAASILLISYLHLTDNYELETLDFRFHLRPKPVTTDKVVLIEIGDDTIRNLGQWPITRNYHALLIKALSEAQAKSIIFDIFFSEPATDDEDLEQAVQAAGNVYLPFVFELEYRKTSPFAVAAGYAGKELKRFSLVDKGEGHINIFPDIDGKFRRVPLLISYKDKWYPHISFLATCNYLGIPIKNISMAPGKYISLGDTKIPIDDHSNMMINFSGLWDKAYKHYSYFDIVQSYLAPIAGQKPILDLNIFKDKMCIVGLTATGTADLHPNPFESLYPGFGIHAEIFNSILNKRFISRASKEANILILLFMSVLIVIATLRMRPLKGLLFLAALEFSFRLAGILVFNIFGIWIDLFYPMIMLILIYLSLTLYKYIAEWKKSLIMEAELGIAKKIQESFLPKAAPNIEGLDISSVMFTARQVGGDLYDFRYFDSGPFGVMIGDVSGKGIPASLFMAMVTSKFDSLAASLMAPEDVLGGLNAKLVKESSSNLFVTMFYLIFDMKKKKVRFSSGGHLPVIYLNHHGEVELLDVPDGTPLGLVDSSYSGRELSFNKDDIFVLYTDGVTEAMNAKGELYGEERLVEAVRAFKSLNSKGMIAAIEKEIHAFEPKAKQHDDITLIVMKII